jgi:hypothetical protein
LIAGLDVRVMVAPDTWTPTPAINTIIARNSQVNGGRGWQFYLRNDGRLQVRWYPTGDSTPIRVAISSVTPAGVVNGEPTWLRLTLERDVAGQSRVRFYQSPAGDGATWTEIGTPVLGTTGPTELFLSANPLTVGGSGTAGTSDNLLGKYFRAIVQDGIDGPVLADPDFTAEYWPVGLNLPAPRLLARKDNAGNDWAIASNARIEGVATFDRPPIHSALPAVIGDTTDDLASLQAVVRSLARRLAEAGLIDDQTT